MIWFQCVSAGLQGFFLVFAWIQVGLGFSPLAAGLTALALSAGSFALAAASVPLAQRHGRWILATGGALMPMGAAALSSSESGRPTA